MMADTVPRPWNALPLLLTRIDAMTRRTIARVYDTSNSDPCYACVSVSYDPEFSEYRAAIMRPRRYEAGDYFTNDKEDAIATAAKLAQWAADNLKA